jgi:predicted transcriptional regulator
MREYMQYINSILLLVITLSAIARYIERRCGQAKLRAENIIKNEHGQLVKESKYRISVASLISITIIALAYRGYWKSAGRASQRGLDIGMLANCWTRGTLVQT